MLLLFESDRVEHFFCKKSAQLVFASLATNQLKDIFFYRIKIN